MRFSERYGRIPVRNAIQIDSMDTALRNSLWNVLTVFIWERVVTSGITYTGFFRTNPAIEALCYLLWGGYWKLPIDTLHDNWQSVSGYIREYFFKAQWFEVYDFMEFVVQNYPFGTSQQFISACNGVLETECSAYRIVNNLVTRITEESEVSAVEDALSVRRDHPARIHLQRALELMSNRQRPDYRNSIKESISAVEGMVMLTLGERGTLGQLIKKLEDEIGLHPALRSAFSSLYGYTSDEGGIRHAIMESTSVGCDEAKFFLVVCSAFVSFATSRIAAIPR